MAELDNASDAAAKKEHLSSISDPKKSSNKDTLAASLASSNPLSSNVWWFIKHPVVRMLTVIMVLFANIYVYLGDPASFSSAKSYGTLVGDIYYGWAQPGPTPGLRVLRTFYMLFLACLGTYLGIKIQQNILRDYFKLVLFGYDNKSDPDRDPICNQDGAFFVVFSSVSMLWYVGLNLWRGIGFAAGVKEKLLPDSGMHGLTFASYNLILGGLMSWAADWYAVVAVTDQMLQGIKDGKGTGYLAYANADQGHAMEPVARTQWLRDLADWWGPRRVLLTRGLLLVGWPPVLVAYYVNYLGIMETLTGSEPDTHVTVGTNWAWSTEWNDEYMRMLAASLVAFLNLVIVAQDWDFPDFSGEDIKIVAVDFSSFRFRVPQCLVRLMNRCPDMNDYLQIYISAKWFNYFGLFMGIGFDWAYWFMTALCFRPCDYAQLWDGGPAAGEPGYIYSMMDRRLQDIHAGAASAANCSWFTANALEANFFERDPALTEEEQPYVVRVGTGIFTGAYTIDEQDAYVWSGGPAVKMWLMCIPPLFGWVTVAWLIFTHERVTCFNYHKVISWFERHPDHEGGGSDGKKALSARWSNVLGAAHDAVRSDGDSDDEGDGGAAATAASAEEVRARRLKLMRRASIKHAVKTKAQALAMAEKMKKAGSGGHRGWFGCPIAPCAHGGSENTPDAEAPLSPPGKTSRKIEA